MHKSYHMPVHRVESFKERVLHPFRVRRVHELRALDDVSLDIQAGEFFGIVGPQRLGQEHAAQVHGRHLRAPTAERSTSTAACSTFIELGVGFNPDLAARDNIMLNA